MPATRLRTAPAPLAGLSGAGGYSFPAPSAPRRVRTVTTAMPAAVLGYATLTAMSDRDGASARKPAPRQFATTRWSIILDARGTPAAARAALEQICCAYRHPVLAYIRRCGHAAPEAEDLAQEFFARMLETRWDTRADPARGRFRSFLLTALKRFLANADAAAHACKRGGRQRHVEFDDVADLLAAPSSHSPEQVFERAWALTVIERAYGRLREETARAGKQALFERFAPYLSEPADADDYRRLGAELDMRPNTVAVTVHRLRLRLRALVWEELADQSDSAQAVETELRALRTALLSEAAGTKTNSGG